MSAATSGETQAERLARLRAEKAAREATLEDERVAFELRELELDARYTNELGRSGVDWAMVSDVRLGVIVVVKLGADLAFRRFTDAVATAEGAPDADALFQFTAPCVVYPTQDEYAELVRKRGFVSNRCADAVMSLHAMRQKKIEGKF